LDVGMRPVGQQPQVQPVQRCRDSQRRNRVTEIVLAVAERALAVLPGLAPVNRGERDEPRRRVADGVRPDGRVERAAVLQRMTIGRVVPDTAAGGAAADHVRFGGMQVAAGRIDAERPARAAELLPRRQAERMAQHAADRGEPGTRSRMMEERDWSADERTERSGLTRPVEISERAGEPREVMLGAVVVAVNDAPVAHDAISALVSFIRRSISSIAWVIWARRRSLAVAVS